MLIKRIAITFLTISLSVSVSVAAKLMCPETADETHRKEIIATSAPEVKVRASAQDDGKRWSDIVRPLTQKAIKAAKAQRATTIQEGIDHGCPSNQTFVAQYVPVPDRPSGCEHKVVTRNGDEGHIYVQVIAVCKYDWMCCSSEEPAPAHTTSSSNTKAVGYKLEGPIAGNSASVVQSSASTTAPAGLKK